MIFETDRLVIKKLSLANLVDFHRIHGDPEVMQSIPAPIHSLEESSAHLSSIIDAYQVQKHRLRIWGAFLKFDDKFVGVCAAIRLRDPGRDIGYRILKKYWGQGLGTELANGLINYLSSDSSIEYLTASVDGQNIASIKILDQCMTFLKEEYIADIKRYERRYILVLKI